MEFACSFAPELYKSSPEERLKLLKFVNSDMDIRDVRIGLRWRTVGKRFEHIDLTPYHQYIEYCLKNKLRVTLNLGPVKTFRWPETHLPDYVIKSRGLNEGRKPEEINLDDELSKLSLEYLDKLLESLKKEYGNSLDDWTMQAENESFYPFGIYKLYIYCGIL